MKRLADLERRASETGVGSGTGRRRRAADAAASLVRDAGQLRRDALLANPLLNFDRLLLVRRKADQLGLPQNWQGNCALPRDGYDNEIAVLSPVRPEGTLTTLYQPPKERVRRRRRSALRRRQDAVLDARQRTAAGRFGRSAPTDRPAACARSRPDDPPDVDNYDACYLPDERIIFASTRCFARRAVRGRRQHRGQPVPA